MNEPNNLLRSIFDEAAELPDPSQRAAFLQRACSGDVDLRRKVEALLQAHDQTSGPLDQPGVPVPNKTTRPAFALTEKPGDRIGRYKLREQIGEGGGGVVYVAEQEEPVRRHVALKILKLGMDTKSVIARFEAERQALALMDHPNIAKVFDAGATDAGRPYFVMELVRGSKITDYCDQNNLSTEERLKLFIQVCNAIQHAHQKGIIHRDIKPSNVLVTSHDGTPVPKVIDFGIAKVTSDQRLTDKTIYTAFEQFIGTPAYMSPEQAGMSGLDIDTRSDIYSLGVLLYELLTGQTPFHAKQLLQAGMDEMRRTIREKEPARPSTRLSTMLDADLTEIAKHRRAEPGKLASLIRGDLDWIVMKALEKDRARRYEDITGFAQDVKRYLTSEPVTARPPSLLYLFQKIIRRKKLEFAAATAVAAALLIGLAVSTWLFARATEARGQVQQRQLLEESQVVRLTARSAGWSQHAWSFATDAARIPTRMSSNDVRDQAAAALAGLDAQRTDHFTNFGASSVLYDREGLQLLMGSLGEGTRLWAGASDARLVSTNIEPSPVAFVEGRTPAQFIFDAERHSFTLLNLTNAQPIRDWAIPGPLLPRTKADERPRLLAISSEGSVAVAVLKLTDRKEAVVIFRSDSATVLRESATSVSSVALSPDGSLLAIAESSGQVEVWSSSGGQRIAALRGSQNEIHDMALKSVPRTVEAKPQDPAAHSSWLLAAGDEGGNVTVWDIQSKVILAHCRGGLYQVSALAFSPDGTTLASGGRGPVKLWDVATGRLLLDIRSGDKITSLIFSPDGSRLAASCKGFIEEPPSVSIWHLDYGRGIQSLRGLSTQISKLCFSADGSRIAALSHEWDIGIWDVMTGQLLRVVGAPKGYLADNAAIALSSDGEQLAFSSGKTARRWDVDAGRLLNSWDLPEGLVDVMAFPDASRLLLFRVETGCRIRDLLHPQPANALVEIRNFIRPVLDSAVQSDGRRFVVEGTRADDVAGRIFVGAFDSFTGKELWSIPLARTNGSGALIADSSGKFIVLQTKHSSAAVLLKLATGIVEKSLPWLPCAFCSETALYVSPGRPPIHERGCSLFSGTMETPALTLGIDQPAISLARFNPAGNRLAWGNTDGTVTVCDLKEIKERLAGANLQW